MCVRFVLQTADDAFYVSSLPAQSNECTPNKSSRPVIISPQVVARPALSLLKLPLETRFLIYSYLLPSIKTEQDSLILERGKTSLFSTCKQIHQECITLMKAKDVFLANLQHITLKELDHTRCEADDISNMKHLVVTVPFRCRLNSQYKPEDWVVEAASRMELLVASLQDVDGLRSVNVYLGFWPTLKTEWVISLLEPLHDLQNYTGDIQVHGMPEVPLPGFQVLLGLQALRTFALGLHPWWRRTCVFCPGDEEYIFWYGATMFGIKRKVHRVVPDSTSRTEQR